MKDSHHIQSHHLILAFKCSMSSSFFFCVCSLIPILVFVVMEKWNGSFAQTQLEKFGWEK
jgi:hypothetical protein